MFHRPFHELAFTMLLWTYPGVVSHPLLVLLSAAVVLAGVPDGVVLRTGPSMLSYTEPVIITNNSLYALEQQVPYQERYDVH